MALRKIVLQGEPCLTKVCRPVTEFNGRLHTLLDDLKDTLLDSGGVGLAAPQVGILRRVCVVMNEDDEIIELVNPEIIATDGEQTGLEGCLSVPGKWGIVTRPNRVRVRAQDRDGDWFEAEAEGLTARAFCHEIEHLDGHLFVEHTDHLMTEEELEHQRRSQEVLGRLTAPMAGMDYEEFSLGGMNAAWMRLKAPHGSRHAILYCHGGGYTSGNLGYSRVLSSKLAHVTGYDVLSFEYRLAPEHPYPAAVEDAMRAWDYLMYQGYGAENVAVAGDSAGGNLALVLCRRLKAAGRRMPRALLLMSPWTDMTMSGASYRERVESDPMLTPEYIETVRRAYAGDRDLHDPDLSPLLGDLGSFPPTLIQVGDHEILYSDSASLAAALRAAHVPCRLEVSEGMWHVFQMFPIKKAAAAMDSAARFLLEL